MYAARVEDFLDGHATAVGASVVVTRIAARQGYPISFWQLTRYGIAVTVLLTWHTSGCAAWSSPDRPL